MKIFQWRKQQFAWPAERPSSPDKAAVAAFLAAHPGEHIAWTRVAGDEEDRYVIGVFYGRTRPPRYQFFSVLKASQEVQALEDDSAYRPKGWR